MCRLFGMSAGAEPAKASFWLLDAPDSLSVQSHREPDGAGIGWFDQNKSHVSKQPIAAFADPTFARRAHEVASRTFVAHVRFASTGSLERRNTHPFEQAGRLFAHNGVVEGLDVLEAHLGPAVELVHGETDSERLFALITKEIAAADGDVAAGIATACEWVAANLPLLSINFILTTPTDVWALRYPEAHELYLLEREPGSPLLQRSGLGTSVTSAHGATHPLVVLASERMDEDPGWRLLGSGELLHIDASLRVRTSRLLSSPPARELSIADLSARAAASQATAPTSAPE